MSNHLSYAKMRSVELACVEHIKQKKPKFSSVSAAAKAFSKNLKFTITRHNMERIIKEVEVDRAELIDDAGGRGIFARTVYTLRDKSTELEARVAALESLVEELIDNKVAG